VDVGFDPVSSLTSPPSLQAHRGRAAFQRRDQRFKDGTAGYDY
jgi:hypothetical protein